MTALRWLVPVIFLVVVFAVLRDAGAQPVDPAEIIERQVKAAYLFKFGSYIEWPDGTFASADSALKIGVIGADSLADELAQMAVGRTVNGRTVSVRKLRREDAITECNVLFIGRSDNGTLAEILAVVRGRPVLTVTESADAMALGSIINLVVVAGKVRFEIAQKPGNLVISARLHAAAHKVTPGAS